MTTFYSVSLLWITETLAVYYMSRYGSKLAILSIDDNADMYCCVMDDCNIPSCFKPTFCIQVTTTYQCTVSYYSSQITVFPVDINASICWPTLDDCTTSPLLSEGSIKRSFNAPFSFMPKLSCKV